jgi:hypothetical protein
MNSLIHCIFSCCCEDQFFNESQVEKNDQIKKTEQIRSTVFESNDTRSETLSHVQPIPEICIESPDNQCETPQASLSGQYLGKFSISKDASSVPYEKKQDFRFLTLPFAEFDYEFQEEVSRPFVVEMTPIGNDEIVDPNSLLPNARSEDDDNSLPHYFSDESDKKINESKDNNFEPRYNRRVFNTNSRK